MGKAVIDASPAQSFDLESQKMKLSAGTLGTFFGTGPNVPLYIAALTIILLMVGGLAAMFLETKMPAADYWKLAAPIITGALGFVFGRKT
jgi:hypothetical protein